jgi:hypothetical protein
MRDGGSKTKKRRGGSRWSRAKRRFHKPKKIPILPIGGALIGGLVRDSDGVDGPVTVALQGNLNPMQLLQLAVRSYAGVSYSVPGGYNFGPGVKFDAGRMLNIFDMGYAPGFKYTVWGGIGSIVARWLGITRRVQPYMQKIPIVKKFTL